MSTFHKILNVLFFIGISCVVVCIVLFCHKTLNVGVFESKNQEFIVSVLSLLVAFLVGWQIYSTINAKQELDTFKNSYDDRLIRLEDCCNKYNNEIERIDKYPFLRDMYNEAVQYLNNNNYVSAIKNFSYVGKSPYDYFFIRNSVTKIADILSRYRKQIEKNDVKFELSSLVKILDERLGVVDPKDLNIIKRYLESEESHTQA